MLQLTIWYGNQITIININFILVIKINVHLEDIRAANLLNIQYSTSTLHCRANFTDPENGYKYLTIAT